MTHRFFASRASFIGKAPRGYTFVNAEAEAYVARITPEITNAEKAVYDTFVGALKAAGSWAKGDHISHLRAPNSGAAYQNMAKDDHHITAVGSPTFTPYVGGATNGTSSYFEIDYIPDTDKVQLAQNSATLICQLLAGTDAQDSTASAMGVTDGTRRLFMPVRNTSDQLRGAINQAGNSVFSAVSPATRLGMWGVSRTGAGALEGYRNGSSVGTDTDASNGVTQTYKVWVGCHNNAGAFADGVANTIGFIFIGAALTSQEHADTYTAVAAYDAAMAALAP